MKKFKEFIDAQETLEKRLFALVLLVGAMLTVVSALVTLTENLGIFSIITTLLCSAAMLALIYVTYFLKKPKYTPLVLCCLLSFVLVPLNFFACGGINSGMPLYLLAVLFLIVPTLKGKTRISLFVLTLITDIGMIILSYFMRDDTPNLPGLPNRILVRLDEWEQTKDVLFSLVITGSFIFLFTSLMMSAYQREREEREQLLRRVTEMSRKDYLTGLYNRRELYDFMENRGRELFAGSYYAAMFDIDHFKQINDTYGHLFGDKALSAIAQEIGKEAHMDFNRDGDSTVSAKDPAEIAARYGGEEFFLIFRCGSPGEAHARIEGIRERVSRLNFPEMNGKPITLSAGISRCRDYTEIRQVVKAADQMLYLAKDSGRDRICTAW